MSIPTESQSFLKITWNADMAELADALDSGSSARKGVEVQVLLSAPIQKLKTIARRDGFLI